MSFKAPDYGHAIEIHGFIDKVLQRRNGWALQDAAEACDRCDRTIHRWVDALAEVYQTPDGNPGIRFETRQRRRYIVADPAAFTSQAQIYDYAALSMALKMVDFAKDTALAGGLRNVKADIEKTRRKESKGFADLGDRLYVRHQGARLNVNSEAIDELLSGIVHYRRVRVVYDDKDDARVVEPLALAIFQEGVYVWVRSPKAPHHIYSLAAQRIHNAELLVPAERFEYPVDWSLDQVLANRFGLLPGKKVVKASIRFAPTAAARYVCERNWHPSQTTENLGDGSVRLRLEVEDAPDFISWICGFGGDAVVEGPKSLRTQVANRLSLALKAYTKESRSQ